MKGKHCLFTLLLIAIGIILLVTYPNTVGMIFWFTFIGAIVILAIISGIQEIIKLFKKWDDTII